MSFRSSHPTSSAVDHLFRAAAAALRIHSRSISGLGIGYSAGAGLTLPIASVVSLAFHGNWNVGHYDMIAPQGVSERGLKHEYFELGVGLALR